MDIGLAESVTLNRASASAQAEGTEHERLLLPL